MRLAVIGTGYVGLVTGTCFAEMGNDVVCVDIDPAKVETLSAGQVPFFEPGLEPLLAANLAAGRLRFSTDIAAGVRDCEVVFLAVGTPMGDDGSADVQQVLAAARAVGGALGAYCVIATKSTVPVGTADKVRDVVATQTRHPFDVVSNPEFLKEGAAVQDFMKPDRVVVGTSSVRARDVLTALYAPFIRTNNPIIFTDVRSAEMTKYAANAFLATRISFINEIALLCERVGADVSEVRRGMGADHRIGYQFLFPGLGYGGSCFPKDMRALIHTGREAGMELGILVSADAANQRMRQHLLDKIGRHYATGLSGLKFAVWGLSFKPMTDDIREAPALTVIDGLLDAGAAVRAHDPAAMANVATRYGTRVTLAPRAYDALDGADGLIVGTEWNAYRTPDFDQLRQRLRQPVIFDGRNLYDGARLARLGFTYYGVGRRDARP